jgi:Tfp pilus assembly protein PilX
MNLAWDIAIDEARAFQDAESLYNDIECPFQNFLSRLNHLCDFKESHLIRGETANVDA